MALAVGSTLGPYQVTALIGAGGMGQVYRATDTQLNREVALKILPDTFVSDPDRVARFQREAQVLASLNHPGIATIYGIARSADAQALVLELVEGPTLADRIAKGPIPLDETLPIAKQIAEALEAAHEAGVIHRDLKPANIKVRGDGTVKLLDFGLAKAVEPASAAPEAGGDDPSPSTALTVATTEMGVIVGTAAYMPPEQARGTPVDKRADIWAFAAVTYEMLTGRRPFEGDGVTDTLAAVLRADVDWTALPDGTPASLAQLIRRGLERDPRRRLRDVGEARVVLEELTTGAASRGGNDRPVVATGGPTRGPLIAALAGGGIAGFALAVLVGQLGVDPSSVDRRVRRFSVPVPRVSLLSQQIAISSDGQQIVYAGERDGTAVLFQRRLDQLEPQLLRGTEDASTPAFSPDGRWVGFRSGDTLRKVSLDGGLPVGVADVPDVVGVAWSPDGMLVVGQASGPLLNVPEGGGTPRPLTALADGERGHVSPEVLLDGRAVLFTAHAIEDDAPRVVVQWLETGERRNLLPGSSPRLVDTGHLVFARGITLWAVPIDLRELTIAGDPVPVLDGVNTLVSGTAFYAIASDGTLVYRPRLALTTRLVWMTRDGTARAVDQVPPAIHHEPIALSPDGDLWAVTRHRDDGTDEVMLHDVSRGTSRPIVTAQDSRWPVWTPDGGRLAFASTQSGSWDIYAVALDGSTDAEPLVVREGMQFPLSWSPDGRTLVFFQDPESDGSLWTLTGRDDPRQVMAGESMFGATIAPSGDRIAFSSDLTGRREVYVQSWPDLERRTRVSTEGGNGPRWAADGAALYFEREDGVYSVALEPEPGRRFGLPERVVTARFPPSGLRHYDVTADGAGFVVLQPESDGPGQSIQVVLGWSEELKARVPIP